MPVAVRKMLTMPTSLVPFVTPKEWNLAKRIQQREQGDVRLILWRLGFISIYQLAELLEREGF